MKKVFLILCFFISISTIGQNHVDALRYSYLEPLGTARFSSLSGSFSALGGDLSSVHQNPAGLGIYRTDEVSLTINSNVISSESTYSNNFFQNEKNRFSIQNMGYVKTLRINNDNNSWNRFSFGLTYNRLKDFNKETTILGDSDESRINTFLNNSQGIEYTELNAFSEYLAYSTYLIDTVQSTSSYESAIGENLIQSSHQNNITQSGFMDELSITMSGAYSDKLFIGVQLGFVGINYREFNLYKEFNFETIANYEWGNLNEFSYSQDLDVIGAGVNCKLGFIFKPYNWIRLGGSYHSKTHFEIEENWQSSMTTSFLNEEMGTISDISPYGFGNYILKTPSKSIASLAFIIAKRGLISVELENIDYSSTKLEADYYNFLEENSNISNYYRNTTNIRVGTEWRFGDVSLRGGIGVYSSPFSFSLDNSDRERIQKSFGIGYKTDQYFLDCSIVNSHKKEDYYMFDGSSATENIENSYNLIFSLGYKF